MPEENGAEIVAGADEIAKFINVTTRQVRHWHETNRLPTFKIGTTICARKASLRAYFEKLEAADGGS